MRIGFPQLVIASLALHMGVGAAFFLPHLHSQSASHGSAASTNPPAIILIGQTASFEHGQSTNPPSSSQPRVATGKATLPSPSQPMLKKTLVTSTPAQTLALASKANPHLRLLPPPDAVLSPQPAPRLDGHAGVVFLLDVSGSMYEPYAGSTRMALAREALTPLLQSLPDGTPFSVILYGERSRLSGPLVAASETTREAAIRFIRIYADCGGGTNLPDALAWASQMDAGQIVIVSDGELNSPISTLLAKAADILGPKGHCPVLTIVGIAPRTDPTSSLILSSLARQQGGTYRIANAELLTANHTAASDTP